MLLRSDEDLAKMLDVAGLQKLQDAFALVQQCIYEYEGTINKFLVDDKGSTVIAAFGLPPVTHENDPIRGILSSLAICAALSQLGLKASVGITTGTALCGVVGHQGNRREYTVLGDIVNLSARLMQKAKTENGGVITDETTKMFTHDILHFEERAQIMVKGKNDSIKVHRPYPRMSILMEFHLSVTSGKKRLPLGLSSPPTVSRATPVLNMMENMHRVQVRDAQRRLSMRADQQSVTANAIIESDSFQQIRNSLLEKCSHLNRFAPGGSFILEGDIGVGKTMLLRSALTCPEAGCYNVLQGTANPFSTRKPYAIWTEIITKCALEGRLSSLTPLPLHDDLMTANSASNGSVNVGTRLDDFSKEAERRKRIALYVRKMIKQGAAPNTTLVKYAYLLNPILDTKFEDYMDEDDCRDQRSSSMVRGSSIRLLEKDEEEESADEADVPETNQEEEPEADEKRFVDTPSNLEMKAVEIAAWFLGLLEMDLAMNRNENDELRVISSKSSETVRSSPSSPCRGDQENADVEWKPTELDLSGILLLCALHAMSRDKATIFCLDNAMYMDEKSWILTTIIAKYFTNCLVVVGTRPPSLALNENTASSSFRKRLRVLKKMRSSVTQTMEPLCKSEIEELALQILNVQVIPSELVSILASRAQGNPLFLHEIIAEMLQQEVVCTDFCRILSLAVFVSNTGNFFPLRSWLTKDDTRASSKCKNQEPTKALPISAFSAT